jgi:hypothetical protein
MILIPQFASIFNRNLRLIPWRVPAPTLPADQPGLIDRAMTESITSSPMEGSA